MRIGYLECFAGISGDMLMGALVDAGRAHRSAAENRSLARPGSGITLSRVNRSGIQSTKIDVMVEGKLHEPAAPTDLSSTIHDHHHDHGHNHHDMSTMTHHHGRSLPQIRSLLMAADLTQRARNLSLSAFTLLAQAEGRIHGVPVEEVHFHEVGAVDAIVDIACSAAAADALDVDEWYCSPVNVGSGFVNCAHGRFPVPAPATAELLKNAPGVLRARADGAGYADWSRSAAGAGLPL